MAKKLGNTVRPASAGQKQAASAKQQTVHQRVAVLNEKPLHAALKEWYRQPGDRFEVCVDGFVVDIVRGPVLVEIQTRNFAAIKRKLAKLAVHNPVRLVYPIARDKWIVKLAEDGKGFIAVTHKVTDALKIARRFMFLKNGTILLDGNRDELVGSTDPHVRQFFSELDMESEVQ